LPIKTAEAASLTEASRDTHPAVKTSPASGAILYRCGPGADVEELTARTFEKAWRARHRYRRDLAAFGTWLLSIARNVAIDEFRARRPFLPLEAAAGVPAGGRSPEEAALLQSDAARLAGLLERLPERDRELLALKFGAGLANREIAAATGLSDSNVGTILSRAVQNLRRQWPGDER
jgi:RNA polymerase sigma-70 factor (ECF subfamily)